MSSDLIDNWTVSCVVKLLGWDKWEDKYKRTFPTMRLTEHLACMLDGEETMCKRSVWMDANMSIIGCPQTWYIFRTTDIFFTSILFVESWLGSDGLLEYLFSLQYELHQTNIAIYCLIPKIPRLITTAWRFDPPLFVDILYHSYIFASDQNCFVPKLIQIMFLS